MYHWLKEDFVVAIGTFLAKYLMIQNTTSIKLRMLIPVNNPRVPPNFRLIIFIIANNNNILTPTKSCHFVKEAQPPAQDSDFHWVRSHFENYFCSILDVLFAIICSIVANIVLNFHLRSYKICWKLILIKLPHFSVAILRTQLVRIQWGACHTEWIAQSVTFLRTAAGPFSFTFHSFLKTNVAINITKSILSIKKIYYRKISKCLKNILQEIIKMLWYVLLCCSY